MYQLTGAIVILAGTVFFSLHTMGCVLADIFSHQSPYAHTGQFNPSSPYLLLGTVILVFGAALFGIGSLKDKQTTLVSISGAVMFLSAVLSLVTGLIAQLPNSTSWDAAEAAWLNIGWVGMLVSSIFLVYGIVVGSTKATKNE